MTRTKSELKAALGMCSRRIGQAVCEECAYNNNRTDCFVELNRDALEYIMELEGNVPKGAYVTACGVGGEIKVDFGETGSIGDYRKGVINLEERQAKIVKVETDCGRGDPAPTMEKKPCPVERGKLLIGLEFCRVKIPRKPFLRFVEVGEA